MRFLSEKNEAIYSKLVTSWNHSLYSKNKVMFLYSHDDLDGAGCSALLKQCHGKFQNHNCSYKNINEKLYECLNYIDQHMDIIYSPENKIFKIFITDISVDEEVAERIEKVDKRFFNTHGYHLFLLLDHHPTASWLNKYDWAIVFNSNIYQDISHCGTSLLFEYFDSFIFNENNSLIDNNTVIQYVLLSFVNLIKDYDLWTWKENKSELSHKLGLVFSALGIDEFLQMCYKSFTQEEHITDLDIFKIISRSQTNKIQNAIDFAIDNSTDYVIDGKVIKIVPSGNFINEVGDYFYSNKEYQYLDGIGMMFYSKGDMVISFRGDGRTDLGKWVKQIQTNDETGFRKAGGHAQACGFSVPLDLGLNMFNNDLLSTLLNLDVEFFDNKKNSKKSLPNEKNLN